MRAFLMSICCCLCCAAADTPFMSISIGDMQGLRAAAAKSFWGRLMADDLIAARAGIAKAIDEHPEIAAVFEIWKAYVKLDALSVTATPNDRPEEIGARVRFDGDVGDLRAILTNTHPKGEAGSLVTGIGWHDGGDHLVLALNDHLQAPERPAAEATLHVSLDMPVLLAAMAKLGRQEAVLARLLERLVGSIDATIEPSPAGLHQETVFHWRPAGLAPIDGSLLQRFGPSHNLAAIGIDLGAFWQAHGEAIFQAIAEIEGEASTNQARTMIDGVIQGMFQRPGGLPQLLGDIHGTMVIAIDGSDLMGLRIAIVLPRCPGIDDLIQVGLGMVGNAPPIDGTFTFLTLPGLGQMGGTLVPGAIAIGRNQAGWIISTDSLFADDFVSGTSGGWNAGALADELATSDHQICLLARNDLSAAFAFLPQIGGSLANLVDRGAHGQALIKACHDLARQAGPSLAVGRLTATSMTITGDGPFGGNLMLPLPTNLPMISIIAAIAIPNLLESRVTANEAAAAATLKSGVFPSQVTFQAGGWRDRDLDGIGEYGFIPYFTGAMPIDGQNLQLSLMAPNFRSPQHGYRYAVYLPAGAQSAADSSSPTTVDANLAERYFVVYAWPEAFGETGRRAFAIDQTGQLFTQSAHASGRLPSTGPAWNSLYDGGTWGDLPGGDWISYRR